MTPEKQLATGHHALVADLYRSYASVLLMYICRQVPTREDAEDILLEVFQAAVESETLATLDDSKQRSWLWTVARHKASDHHRRIHRRPIPSATLEEVEEALYEDDSYAPESCAVRQETHAELRKQVSSLPEHQQYILRLRFAYGFTCVEIAQRLNKSSTAIRAMLSRSLNLLRESYQQRKEDTSNGE